jgi:hypothetical protein
VTAALGSHVNVQLQSPRRERLTLLTLHNGRGKALLSYMDVETGRLAMHTAGTGASPAAGTGKSSGISTSSASGSGISLNSLFSHVGTLGQALLGAHAGNSGGSASGRDAAVGAPAQAPPQDVLWAQLRVVQWCPVSMTSNHQCMRYQRSVQCLLCLPM